jgi:uncharacterized protein (UPF0335 family)
MSLKNIEEDVKEIKQDIKEVKQELRSHSAATEGGS